jgi:hypothetical protein
MLKRSLARHGRSLEEWTLISKAKRQPKLLRALIRICMYASNVGKIFNVWAGARSELMSNSHTVIFYEFSCIQ